MARVSALAELAVGVEPTDNVNGNAAGSFPKDFKIDDASADASLTAWTSPERNRDASSKDVEAYESPA